MFQPQRQVIKMNGPDSLTFSAMLEVNHSSDPTGNGGLASKSLKKNQASLIKSVQVTSRGPFLGELFTKQQFKDDHSLNVTQH